MMKMKGGTGVGVIFWTSLKSMVGSTELYPPACCVIVTFS